MLDSVERAAATGTTIRLVTSWEYMAGYQEWLCRILLHTMETSGNDELENNACTARENLAIAVEDMDLESMNKLIGDALGMLAGKGVHIPGLPM